MTPSQPKTATAMMSQTGPFLCTQTNKHTPKNPTYIATRHATASFSDLLKWLLMKPAQNPVMMSATSTRKIPAFMVCIPCRGALSAVISVTRGAFSNFSRLYRAPSSYFWIFSCYTEFFRPLPNFPRYSVRLARYSGFLALDAFF